MSLIKVRKIATLDGEDKRDGKDSIAADAKFKKGDKVTVKTKWAGTRKGIVKEVINDPALKKAYVVEIEGAETAAYPAEIVSADACEDSSELNNDADLRAALSKMADIAKRLTDAKVSFKAGWTPDGIGEIILEFPNIESARKYNYYKLFNAWEAARSQIVPRWAVNIGGYRVPRIEGNRMTISILHFST
jgi:hypothetical protein